MIISETPVYIFRRQHLKGVLMRETVSIFVVKK
jgi:hypothetical protein